MSTKPKPQYLRESPILALLGEKETLKEALLSRGLSRYRIYCILHTSGAHIENHRKAADLLLIGFDQWVTLLLDTPFEQRVREINRLIDNAKLSSLREASKKAGLGSSFFSRILTLDRSYKSLRDYRELAEKFGLTVSEAYSVFRRAD